MPHKIIDNAGRRKLTLTDGGRAYLFQAGIYEGSRMGKYRWCSYADEEDGSEVKLVPGKTWISFVPT